MDAPLDVVSTYLTVCVPYIDCRGGGSGPIPTEIGDLAALTELRMKNNRLAGAYALSTLAAKPRLDRSTYFQYVCVSAAGLRTHPHRNLSPDRAHGAAHADQYPQRCGSDCGSGVTPAR